VRQTFGTSRTESTNPHTSAGSAIRFPVIPKRSIRRRQFTPVLLAFGLTSSLRKRITLWRSNRGRGLRRRESSRLRGRCTTITSRSLLNRNGGASGSSDDSRKPQNSSVRHLDCARLLFPSGRRTRRGCDFGCWRCGVVGERAVVSTKSTTRALVPNRRISAVSGVSDLRPSSAASDENPKQDGLIHQQQTLENKQLTG
jgi:hypothetical protein